MVKRVLISVALSAILIMVVFRVASLYQEGQPERVTRIDIYADRITYRTGTYSTPTQLKIGLEAAKDPPRKVALHDCASMDDFEAVIAMLRELDYRSFDIELPDDC
jgi:hypothetical protein